MRPYLFVRTACSGRAGCLCAGCIYLQQRYAESRPDTNENPDATRERDAENADKDADIRGMLRSQHSTLPERGADMRNADVLTSDLDCYRCTVADRHAEHATDLFNFYTDPQNGEPHRHVHFCTANKSNPDHGSAAADRSEPDADR